MAEQRDPKLDSTGKADELAAALNAVRSGAEMPTSEDDGEFTVESTQVLDPRQQEELMALRAQQAKKLQRADKHIVVMFTDLVGSTQYYERYGDLKGREKVLTHNALLFPIVQQHNGVIVKTIGDAIMCYFENQTDALRAATKMQQTLAGHNQDIQSQDEQIHIRIALNAGVAIAQQGDIYGDVVNVAARIEHHAQADEILMSASVCDPVKANWPIESAGDATFKGKAEPVPLFRLRWREVQATDARTKVLALPKHFEIVKQLAKSPAGDLFLVQDTKRNVRAVVKRLYDFLAEDQETRAAYVEAAKEQASLEMDGVVRTYEHSQPADLPAYYSVEHIEGPSLQALIAKKGLPKVEDAVVIMQRVATILQAAHTKNVLHRNLDPSNVIVRADGKLVLNNFGAARVSAVAVRRGNSPIGSPAFTSPEALIGSAVSAQSDVYSLGALFYFLLSGREPIEDATSVQGTMVAAQGATVPLKRVAPNAPDALVQIINRTMGLLPRSRYADVGAFLTDLQRATGPQRGESSYLRPAPATIAPVVGKSETNPKIQQPKSETNPKIQMAPPPPPPPPAVAPVKDNPWMKPSVLSAVGALVFVVGITIGVLLGLSKDRAPAPPQTTEQPPPVKTERPAQPETIIVTALTEKLGAADVIEHGDAFVVIEKGRTIVSWKDKRAPERVELGRLSANVAAFSVGRLVDTGKLKSLSEPLSTFFPEWSQGKKRLVTTRHLLEHASGMRAPDKDDALAPPNIIRFALAGDVVDEPGTKPAFNAKAFNLLAGVVQQASGQPIDKFFADEIAAPLGLEAPKWTYDKDQTPITSNGVLWGAADLAKLGAAFIDGGPARERQARLFSEAWLLAAKTPSIADQGVSMLFRLHEIDGVGAVLFAVDPKGSFWLVAPAKNVVAVRLTRTELTNPAAMLPATINALFGSNVPAKAFAASRL